MFFQNPQKPSRKLPPLLNYDDLGPQPSTTRSSLGSRCNCHICSLARQNLTYKKYVVEHSNPVGNPSKPPKPPSPKAVTLCSKCFTEIGRGIPHNCVKVSIKKNKKIKKHFYKAQRVSNLSSIVRKTSVKSRSKVATSTLKTIAESQGVSTRGGVVQLQSGKKELPVQIGAPQTMPRQATFSHENLMRLQTANNLSDRNLKYVVCKIYCQKMQENFEFILKYIIP